MVYSPRVRSRRLADFFLVFKYQDAVEVNKTGKKEHGRYLAFLTEQAWLMEEYFLAQRSGTTIL